MRANALALGLALGCLAGGTIARAGGPGGVPDSAGVVARAEELRLRAEWDAAQALIEEALCGAQQSGDAVGQARLLIELSAIAREVDGYRKRGSRQAAAAHLSRAEALLDGAPRDVHAAFAEERAWLDYSRAFDNEVTFSDVRRSFHDARLLREETRDEAGLAVAWFGIGLAHQQSGELAEARAAFRRALGLAERSKAVVVQGYLQRHLGFVEADLAGTPATALPFYERSLELRRQAGHQWGIVFAQITLGRALAETGRPRRARLLLGRAVDAGTTLRLPRAVAEAEEALADVEWSAKALPAACRHLDAAARWWVSFGTPHRPEIETRRAEWHCAR